MPQISPISWTTITLLFILTLVILKETLTPLSLAHRQSKKSSKSSKKMKW